MEDGSKRRATFTGDAKVLADIMMPFIESPTFFPYRPPTGQQKKAVLAVSGMFKQLMTVQQNLSFPAKKIRMAVHLVQKARNFPFRDDTEETDWKEATSKRLRQACRYTAQSYLKRYKWCTDAIDEGAERTAAVVASPQLQKAIVVEDSGPSQAPPSEKPCMAETLPMQPEFFYGYCFEHKQAWRAPADDAQQKDYTDKLLAEANHNSLPQPDDAVFALWPDGDRHILPNLIRADLKELEASRTPSRKTVHKSLFEGMSPDHLQVVVRNRTDRKLLTIMTEGGKQILQASHSSKGLSLELGGLRLEQNSKFESKASAHIQRQRHRQTKAEAD